MNPGEKDEGSSVPEAGGPAGEKEDRLPDERSEEPLLKRVGVRSVQLLLTVAVTWFIINRVGLTLEDLRALELERWRPGWPLLGASSTLLLGGFLFSASLWGRMVRELGGPAVGPWTSCRIFFTANLGRYVPGKIWQLAGLAYLAGERGVSPPVAVAAAVLGQGIALAGATVVGLTAFFGGGETLRAWGIWGMVGVAFVIGFTSIPGLFKHAVSLWFRIARRDPPTELRIGGTFGIRWLALYTLNWTVHALAFWGLVRSFGLEVGFLEAGPAFAAAYVLGYVMIFAPAGLGIREGFLVAFLQPVLGAGAAAAVAVIARFWTTVVELLPAVPLAGTYLLDGGAGPNGKGREEE